MHPDVVAAFHGQPSRTTPYPSPPPPSSKTASRAQTTTRLRTPLTHPILRAVRPNPRSPIRPLRPKTTSSTPIPPNQSSRPSRPPLPRLSSRTLRRPSDLPRSLTLLRPGPSVVPHRWHVTVATRLALKCRYRGTHLPPLSVSATAWHLPPPPAQAEQLAPPITKYYFQCISTISVVLGEPP